LDYGKPPEFAGDYCSDESFAIVVYTGDKDTGLRHGHPTNKAKKGLKAQQAVLRNTKSGELFPETLQPGQEQLKMF
jgi:hypothetical protein